MPKSVLMSFLKAHLDLIENNDWLTFCHEMFKSSFDPVDAVNLFNLIKNADITIPEKELEKSFIDHVNTFIRWIKNGNGAGMPKNPNAQFVKNGNELHLTKMFLAFIYHKNGWGVDKCYDIVNKNSFAIDWEISKIFP